MKELRVTPVQITIELDDKSTVTTVGGELYGGLAVTPAVMAGEFTGLWNVTHLTTGLKILAGGGICMPHARRVAECLMLSGVDWSRGIELRDDPTAKAAKDEAEYIAEFCEADWCPQVAGIPAGAS